MKKQAIVASHAGFKNLQNLLLERLLSFKLRRKKNLAERKKPVSGKTFFSTFHNGEAICILVKNGVVEIEGSFTEVFVNLQSAKEMQAKEIAVKGKRFLKIYKK